VGTNRETVTAIQKGIYTPNLEALDAFPRFALDTFNVGSVTQKGAVANAKLFAAVKQLDTPKNPRSTNYLAESEFRKATPNILGQKLSQTTGVKMTEKEQNTYGYAMAKVRDVIVKRNPTLANNIAHYTMGNGKNQLTYLMNDEKFTEKAVKNMESHETSAWLSNTLNLKHSKESSVENIFKIKPSKTVDTENHSTRNTPPQIISPTKQPTKNKPVDLLTMQKIDTEGEKQW
jgi:hypothetical protein